MSFFNNQLQSEITKMLELLVSHAPLGRLEQDEYWVRLNKLQTLSQIQIDDIDYKGLPKPLDESVTIRNRGGMTVNISGWRIQAGSPKQTYIFPDNTYLSPYEQLHVDTRGKTEHSFNSNQPIWNNRGDTGTLIDEEGQIVSTLAYGRSADKKIIISHINVDGHEHRSEGDEYVEISNISDEDVMLTDWCLTAKTNNNTFIFPKNAKLEAYSSFIVYTNKTDLKPNEFSFNSSKAIWNNKRGDCRLLDYLDNEMADYHY